MQFLKNGKSKKIDDVFEFLISGINSRNDLNESDEIRCIHYGGIHTKWVFVLNCNAEEIPQIYKPKITIFPLLKIDDLIVADVSEIHKGL